MKKILGVAAAVALATGAVFAEDEGFKANVTVKTGLESNITDKETYGVSSEGDYTRIQPTFSYTGTDYGIVTQFRSQLAPNTAFYKNEAEVAVPTTKDKDNKDVVDTKGKIKTSTDLKSFGDVWLRQAYGYTNLFGGNAKVTSGLLVDTQWDDDYYGESAHTGLGARLELTPTAVQGLNFGASFIAYNSEQKATVNWDKKYWRAGVRYDADLFTALAGWDGKDFAWAQFTLNETPGFAPLTLGASVTAHSLTAKSSEDRDEIVCFNAELSLKKLAEIDAKVGFFTTAQLWQKAGDADDYQVYELDGYAEYQINDKVTALAEGAYVLSTEKDVDGEFFAKAKVNYKPAKKATIGLYYGHNSDKYNDLALMQGWNMSSAGQSSSGNDFIGLDFNYSF